MSWSSKRTILTQELLRVLLRCSPELLWAITAAHGSEIVKRMQFARYGQRFRCEIVESALKAYKDIKEKDDSGEKPMNRNKAWKRIEREKNKRRKKESWYKKGGYDTVVFVPDTPKSTLAKEYRREISKTNIKMKVVETSGRSLKKQLQKSDPIGKKGCTDERCMICRKGGKGDCRKRNVTYKIDCQRCNMKYVGETSRNAFSRSLEHQKAYENKDKESPLHQHTIDKHPDTPPPDFKMSVISTHENALTRQISESVAINNAAESTLMNSKMEWRQNALPECNSG